MSHELWNCQKSVKTGTIFSGYSHYVSPTTADNYKLLLRLWTRKTHTKHQPGKLLILDRFCLPTIHPIPTLSQCGLQPNYSHCNHFFYGLSIHHVRSLVRSIGLHNTYLTQSALHFNIEMQCTSKQIVLMCIVWQLIVFMHRYSMT